MAKTKVSALFCVSGLLLGLAASSARAASEYVTPLDRPEKAWLIFAEDLKPIAPGEFSVNVYQVTNPPEMAQGKPANFAQLLVKLNCASGTFSFAEITWLDENRNMIAQAFAPGMHFTAPTQPKAGTPFAQALASVCPVNGPAWVHADQDAWTVIRQKLASMQGSK